MNDEIEFMMGYPITKDQHNKRRIAKEMIEWALADDKWQR